MDAENWKCEMRKQMFLQSVSFRRHLRQRTCLLCLTTPKGRHKDVQITPLSGIGPMVCDDL